MPIKNRKFFQQIKYQQSLNRQKQLNYNNRFNVLQKKNDYNALEDPHASYYFVGQSVRSHLKNIKRATIQQTSNSIERQKLKKLINEKIKLKPKFLFMKKPGLAQLQQLITNEGFNKKPIETVHSYRKKSSRKQKLLQSKKQSISKSQQKQIQKKFSTLSKQFNESMQSNDKKEKNQQNNHKKNDFLNQQNLIVDTTAEIFRQNQTDINKGQRKSRYQRIHEKRHKKFMNFIEEKRKLIDQLQTNTLSKF